MMIISLILIGLIAISIAFFAFDRDGFWNRTVGNPDLGQTDFSNLKPSKKPNEGLVCPEGYCPNRTPDQISPTYALSASELRSKLSKALEPKPNVTRVDNNEDTTKLRYLTRTPLMHYPDTMSIDFIPLGDNKSTLAIHAKAQVGTSDLGNNLKRIRAWLEMVSQYEDK